MITAGSNSYNPNSVAPSSFVASSHGKEGEVINVKSEVIEDLTKEIELPKEAKEIGMEKIHGVIELPPDIKNIGVTHSGPQAPVFATSATISLPLSDDKILQSAHYPLTSAVKWLSVWCLKRLRSAHLVLKKIHGKIVRVTVP